jgi:hypothetical protein
MAAALAIGGVLAIFVPSLGPAGFAFLPVVISLVILDAGNVF